MSDGTNPKIYIFFLKFVTTYLFKNHRLNRTDGFENYLVKTLNLSRAFAQCRDFILMWCGICVFFKIGMKSAKIRTITNLFANFGKR